MIREYEDAKYGKYFDLEMLLDHLSEENKEMDREEALIRFLYELSKINDVGFLINKVPIAHEVHQFAESNRLNPLDLAFYGGEEYELVVTIKPELLKKTIKAIEKIGSCLIPIGKVIKESQILVEINGKKDIIEPRGWEHFKSEI